ncbi:MAG TPA: hypothetical protein VN841_10295 [Bryobacteraceae bacterium]|nr:hypothetical protein [Bryobacteraceae bacterium]
MKFRFVLLGPDDDPDGSVAGRERDNAALQYEQRGAGMVRAERTTNGRFKSTAVANFKARIVRDIIVDDGETERRDFGIEAELDGRTLSFTLSAAEFGRMGWVLSTLGPQAIIYPGQQQHARAAIQWLSGLVRQERIFSHLGWRKHGPHWVYLHAAGALGAEGPVSDLQVQLPAALQHYQMQSPEEPGERVNAVRASLGLLSAAPDRISFPLLAAVYRAAFGKVDFSVFLAGQTGVFKTALATLCQQHFGAGMDAASLPANFASTGNAVELLAFHAKDAVLVVDDFAPAGGPGDGDLHHVAERLFRGAGNHQGRSRLSGNGRLSAPQPPRALVLATGEEVPRGQSIRARLLIVGVVPGEVNRATLSECQCAGQQGRLAASMGAFLSWIAGRYEELQRRLQTRARELRNQAHPGTMHARLPAMLAELRSGWEIFLDFAFEARAIGRRSSRNCNSGVKQRWPNSPSAKLSITKPAIQRCVLCPCCEPRWPPAVPMWRTGRARYRNRRRSGAGGANVRAEVGFRWAPKSVGSRAATYSWSRPSAIRRPRNWRGPSDSQWASRLSATGCASAAFWPVSTSAARWCWCAAPWRAARDKCFI